MERRAAASSHCAAGDDPPGPPRLARQDGQVLAEIADDLVSGSCQSPPRPAGQGRGTATGPRSPGPPQWRKVSRWREVEVELGAGPRDLLDLACDLLLRAGAVPSTAASKLSRLLGVGGGACGEPLSACGPGARAPRGGFQRNRQSPFPGGADTVRPHCQGEQPGGGHDGREQPGCAVGRDRTAARPGKAPLGHRRAGRRKPGRRRRRGLHPARGVTHPATSTSAGTGTATTVHSTSGGSAVTAAGSSGTGSASTPAPASGTGHATSGGS